MLLAYFMKGSLILVAAFGVCAALRKASAATRHLVWTVAFTALLALPILSRMTPDWTAPVNVPAVFSTEPAMVATTPSAPLPTGVDWIWLVWSIGAVLIALRFLVGTASAWLKVRQAQRLEIAASVPVLDAGPGAMPMTWGVLRPVVLLPSEALTWSAERLRTVLLHELAHVDRRDCLTLAISELALALYWMHPLAWLAVSQMRREREQACDDRVLAAGILASDYAGDLVDIARGQKSSPMVAPAMARGSQLGRRLQAILDPNTRRRSVTRKMAVVAGAFALVMLFPLAALRLQGQGGGLSGVVYDPTGSVVPRASVSIANNDTGATQSLASGLVGEYSFPNLAAGDYQLTVRQPGFVPFVQRVNVPGKLDAHLSIGRVQEWMTVTGRRPNPSAGPESPVADTRPQRIRVGGNVQAAKVFYRANPAYPPRAEAAGLEGVVSLQGVIGKEGGIIGLTLLSRPVPELAEAAMAAVKNWRYSPTLLNGEPVEVVTTINVGFRLDR